MVNETQTLGDTSKLEFMRSRRIIEVACKNVPESSEEKRVVDLLIATTLNSSGFTPASLAELDGKIYEMMAVALAGKWDELRKVAWYLQRESLAPLIGKLGLPLYCSSDVSSMLYKLRAAISLQIDEPVPSTSRRLNLLLWDVGCRLKKLSNNVQLSNPPESFDLFILLIKIDLKIYNNYVELSKALEKMFSCLLWMFIDSCNRLRIMKGSEAIRVGEDEHEL
ncbi:hypothetical protein L1987_28760 [Smallanthus sonchifolius]|uniref:Uncharacterized protein n=1 Tax=Smallanthus sonchifolius TaxID=185202 RepID=A0ACB9HZK3_9ASTR|nr:hypothetical protein L1987_28760 [Smallanthus sonchifolius]